MRGSWIVGAFVLFSMSVLHGGTANAQVVVLRPVVVESYVPVLAPAPVYVTRSVPVTVVQSPVVTARYVEAVPVVEHVVTRAVHIESVPVVRQIQYVAPAPVVVTAKPVIVRPKYYIPGQPVRNAFRAVTP